MLAEHESLISELELAVRSGSAENRVGTLRRVTDLFLNDADRLNDDQIKVFDDVLCMLSAKIEQTALAELSTRLAPVDNAPLETIRRLARNDDIVVAKPILTGSTGLTEGDLVEIAQTKSQQHLLAISGRTELATAVTDVLLERGDQAVVHTLANNTGARFSEDGYAQLLTKSETDFDLAEMVGLRADVPTGVLRELLRRATDAVRARLLALAPPRLRDAIERVIQEISRAVATAEESDFAQAERLIQSMQKDGLLNEAAFRDFVDRRRRDEMIVALARLCSASNKTIENLLMGQRNDAVLVPCKAAGFSWDTAEAVLLNRHPNRPPSDKIVELARSDYAKLSVATAQRTLRFLQVRDTVK